MATLYVKWRRQAHPPTFREGTNALCDDCTFPDLVRRYSLEKT